jgi:putative flippase GtrA
MSLIPYTLVQIAGMGVDYIFFILLIKFEVLSPLFANALGKCIGVMVAFNGHRRLTFPESALNKDASSIIIQALKYSSMLPMNIAVSSILLTSIISAGITAAVAKLVSDLITFILFFAVNKYLVFK